MTDPHPSPTASPTRRKPPLIFKLIALGFVLVMGLVLAEIGIRIVAPGVVGGPMLTQRDKYYGYWLRPNFDREVASSTGIRYRHRTNAQGHRAPEYTDAPRGHVLCLGDSYTMGETVDAGTEFPALMREALRPHGFEVVNFGRAGNGQGRWVKFLERDAKDYRPRVVVLQLCYNDFGDNELENLYSVDNTGALTVLPVPGPRTVDRVRDLVEMIPGIVHLRTYQFIKQQLRAAAGAQGSHPDQAEISPAQRAAQDALTMALLRRTMVLSQDMGARIVWTSVGLSEDRAAMVRGLGAEFGAIEVPIEYKDTRPQLYHANDPHWNEEGHRIVADAILDAIGLPDPGIPAP
jgi:hypothetical protein